MFKEKAIYLYACPSEFPILIRTKNGAFSIESLLPQA